MTAQDRIDRHNKYKKYLHYWGWFLFFSFVIFATWEWVQTPFFIDNTEEINRIVWYRIHCTIGDTMILASTIIIIGLIRQSFSWLFAPSRYYYISTILLGVIYTLFSEYRNVYLARNWDYSVLMPKLFGIGLLPVLQWIVLPPLIMYILKRAPHRNLKLYSGLGNLPIQ